MDSIKEIFSIGIGKAASILNDIVKVYIKLSVLSVKVVSVNNYKNELAEYNISGNLSAIRMKYDNSLSGMSALIFPPDSADKIFSLTANTIYNTNMQSAIKPETLSELGNILLNGVMGSISNILSTRMIFSVPEYVEGKLDHIFEMDELPEHSEILVGELGFEIEQQRITGTIIVVMKSNSFNNLIVGLNKFKNGSLHV